MSPVERAGLRACWAACKVPRHDGAAAVRVSRSAARSRKTTRWPALRSIALGTVLGGGMHAGVGALVDRFTGRLRNPVSPSARGSRPGRAPGVAAGLARPGDRRSAGSMSGRALDLADALRVRETGEAARAGRSRRRSKTRWRCMRRGELTAASRRRDPRRPGSPEDVRGSRRRSAIHVDPQCGGWSPITCARPKPRARAGSALIADQLGYLAGAALRTASEREAAAVDRPGDAGRGRARWRRRRSCSTGVPRRATAASANARGVAAQRAQLLAMHAAACARAGRCGRHRRGGRARKLVAAGVPEEQARGRRIVQARYEARAAACMAGSAPPRSSTGGRSPGGARRGVGGELRRASSRSAASRRRQNRQRCRVGAHRPGAGAAGARPDRRKRARRPPHQRRRDPRPGDAGVQPALFEKTVNAVGADPGLGHNGGPPLNSVCRAHSPRPVQKAEYLIGRLKDNLLWLYDQVPADDPRALAAVVRRRRRQSPPNGPTAGV